MINRLYNTWHITNDGEREADKQLFLPSDLKHEYLSIHYQVRISSRFHKTQMAGECDFIIFSRLGILILEVKGGVMGYGASDKGDHDFYRVINGNEKELVKNPFTQADANANAIKSYLVEKGLTNIFVGSAVCFPECVFDHDSIEYNYLWHRGHQTGLVEMILHSLKDQISDHYEKYSGRNFVWPITWKELGEQEIHHLTDLVKPEFQSGLYMTHTKLSIAESERRLEEGVHILRGLNENQRIMVQGPPGSGKSTYALDLIEQQCSRKNKKGLYLCWNEFLASDVNQKVQEINKETGSNYMKTSSFFNYIVELATTIGDKSMIPSYTAVAMGEMRLLVKDCLEKLIKTRRLPKFDFIIVDEAQDLFEKGIDLLLHYLLKVEHPIENGNYYIFFDDSQAFPKAKDLKQYIQTRDTLKKNSACYVLFSNLRVNTGHGLTELIRDAGLGNPDLLNPYGKDVAFVAWKTYPEITVILNKFINQERLLGQFTAKDMMILMTADLLKEDSPFKPIINSEPGFELLTRENVNSTNDKIRYSTALKVKGLEWNVVFIVCSSITEKKSIFQLFIGASRARVKVYIIHADRA